MFRYLLLTRLPGRCLSMSLMLTILLLTGCGGEPGDPAAPNPDGVEATGQPDEATTLDGPIIPTDPATTAADAADQSELSEPAESTNGFDLPPGGVPDPADEEDQAPGNFELPDQQPVGGNE